MSVVEHKKIRVVFAGTPAFSVACLKALLESEIVEVVGVVSQPDRKSGRGMKLQPSAVKQAALEANIDVITPASLRDNDEALSWLVQKDCDILVVVAFGMILPKPWLEAPKVAPINVHASLLPRWRGAAPIERALLAGDTETGVDIMQMEEGLDTGGVYLEKRIRITPESTGVSLWSELETLGAQALMEAIFDISSGQLQPKAQATTGLIYAKKITNEERVLDWTLDAAYIQRLVRCFTPRPGVRTAFAGKSLKVIAGHLTNKTSKAKAGTIVGVDAGLEMSCGDGGVYAIELLQPEGKKIMAVADFLRGTAMQVGDCLG